MVESYCGTDTLVCDRPLSACCSRFVLTRSFVIVLTNRTGVSPNSCRVKLTIARSCPVVSSAMYFFRPGTSCCLFAQALFAETSSFYLFIVEFLWRSAFRSFLHCDVTHTLVQARGPAHFQKAPVEPHGKYVASGSYSVGSSTSCVHIYFFYLEVFGFNTDCCELLGKFSIHSFFQDPPARRRRHTRFISHTHSRFLCGPLAVGLPFEVKCHRSKF